MDRAIPKSWSSETFYDNNEQYFEQMLLAIALAKSSIVLETYIFSLDKVGRRFIQTLADARRRGVDVRVVIDGIGSIMNSETIVELFLSHDIDCRIFRPLPWQFSLFDNALRKRNIFGKPLYYLRTINHRNHRKMCLIDSRELWSGSLNITQDHLSKEQGGDSRIDFGICVEGDEVHQLEKQFNAFWNDERLDDPAEKVREYIQHMRSNLKTRLRKRLGGFLNNASKKQREQKRKALLEIITESEQRLWLCNAYFSPSADVLNALISSAQQGCDVRLVVSKVSDFAFFPLLTSNYYSALLETGIKIYEYPESFLHAKCILSDDTAIIGSTNLNYRSLFHDLELDIVVGKISTLQSIENSFQRLMRSSEKITKHSKWMRFPILRRLLYLLRYWM